MPRRLNVKMYQTVVRPVLMNGTERWTVRKTKERLLKKKEMRMLRRIKEVSLKDRMKSDEITSGVEVIGLKVKRNRD